MQKNHFLPFIALTETWLNDSIADAQVQLSGYVLSRSDRRSRGGGVLLYSHESIPISDVHKYDDGTCQAVVCEFHTIKTVICNVYRPPSTTREIFYHLLEWISQCLNNITDSYQYILLGDFNFPFIDWNAGKIEKSVLLDQQRSAEEFMVWLSNMFLIQYVTLATRLNNILDLLFTNNQFLVTNISVIDTGMSDHRMIDISISLNMGVPRNTDPIKEGFECLDFRMADFDALNEKISSVPWEELFNLCSFQEFPPLFTMVLLQLCSDLVPTRKPRTGKPKVLNALRRKKKRIAIRLSKLRLREGNPYQISCLETKLALITYEMKEVITNDIKKRENHAISKIKINPKCFYSYAKSHSVMKNNLTMLISNEMVITDKKKIADALQQQFSSVFSNPDDPQIKSPSFPSPEVEYPMTYEMLCFSDSDVLEAVAEIRLESSAGPDGVPSILLKKCVGSLLLPLKLLWMESLNRGEVPDFYKKSHVYPLYKKSDRSKAVNYRPISMTSHVIKMFERILRKRMVSYLERNNLLSQHQHGFRSGKSTLTQLLAHFDNVYESLLNNDDMDVIYLDYSKAFDKVDHRILLLKLETYKFNHLLIQWIRSFLSGRSQEVVINGVHSDSTIYYN